MVAILVEFDTYYVRTYYVDMNITLSIDEKLAERARERLRLVGKSLNQEIRDHLQVVAGGEQRLEQSIQDFRARCSKGNSQGQTWSRDEIYEERLRWPRNPEQN